MTQIGFSLVRLSDGAEVWAGTLPARVIIAGAVCDFDRAGQVMPDKDRPTHKMVERNRIDRPSRFHVAGTESISFDGEKVTVDPGWSVMTIEAARAIVLSEIRAHAGTLIYPSDWMVLRQVSEPGKPVPQAVRAFRKAVRDHCETLEAEVSGIGSVAALASWRQHDWPEPSA